VTALDVSRETLDKLRRFEELVKTWTPKINLVSKSSVPVLWERHIVDSAQLFDLAPRRGLWVDLGSGAGFPAIVVAILSNEAKCAHDFILVESDQRKSAFLRTAIRELDLSAQVLTMRIEAADPLAADILSARALTSLAGLLGFAEQHLKSGGTALFPKGETWATERADANALWSYDCQPIKSLTNPAAAILKIKDVARV